MRAGQLTHRLEVVAITGTQSYVVVQDRIWVGIKSGAGGGEQKGLRAPVADEMICRPRPPVTTGLFLRQGSRLWVVDSVGGNSLGGIIRATELQGEAVVYAPAVGAQFPTIAFIALNTPYIDDKGVSHDHRIDIPKLHLPGGPQRGDTIIARGIIWKVTGLEDGGDDGAVLSLIVRK